MPTAPFAAELFPSGGLAGAVIRSVDWAGTALGPTATWPQALIAQVRAMLHMRQPMCIFWGPELVNLYNDGFLPILGEKHPRAMGQRASDCWSEAWTIVGPQLERVLKGENIYQEEMLVPIARGGRVQDAWWNYSYSPLFDDAGAPAGAVVICTEVTNEVVQRRRTEAAKREAELARQELHGVFMQAPVPMVILSGPQHRFTLVNPSYREFVGHRDVIGKTVREAFTEEEVGRFLPIMDQVLRSGEPVLLQEAPLRLPDRHGVIVERIIDVGYHPHRDATGAVAGILVVVHDVTAQATERKQLQLENRAKDEFLAMLGHELRNPLAPITTALKVMQYRDDAALKRERAVIERHVAHLSGLVDDLLDVSRITRGKVRLDKRPLAVMEAVTRAIEMAEPLIEERGHRLEVCTPPQPLSVDGDPMRLSQVVSNLLTNAARYTPAGGHLRLEVRREGREVVIEVTDNGIGIDAALLPRVFDIFVQGKRPLDRSDGGLGLGLSLVRTLVSLHGGTVEAQSEGRDRGSRFVVRLPLLAEHVLAAAEASPALAPPSAQHPRRVLIVDDNVDAALMMAEVLQMVGHEPLVAHDGAEALSALERFEPSVAFLDIGLPVMDGYELARRIRARGRPIRLVALTGYGRSDDLAKSRAAGFDKHMVKPVVVEDALAVLEGP